MTASAERKFLIREASVRRQLAGLQTRLKAREDKFVISVPSERIFTSVEMTKVWGVARSTASNILGELEDAGYVVLIGRNTGWRMTWKGLARKTHLKKEGT
jgi:hypothetical protein